MSESPQAAASPALVIVWLSGRAKLFGRSNNCKQGSNDEANKHIQPSPSCGALGFRIDLQRLPPLRMRARLGLRWCRREASKIQPHSRPRWVSDERSCHGACCGNCLVVDGRLNGSYCSSVGHSLLDFSIANSRLSKEGNFSAPPPRNGSCAAGPLQAPTGWRLAKLHLAFPAGLHRHRQKRSCFPWPANLASDRIVRIGREVNYRSASI